MPGAHTFNDGSTILTPVANALGVTVDKINLVSCLFVAVPLAIAYNNKLAKSGAAIRQAYPLSIGLAFCWFCFGGAIKHLLANIFICYGLMHAVPAAHVHKAVFVFAMAYLTWIHYYRVMYLDSYTIDVTGAFMVVVQKVTTLAFSLHDGKGRKESDLSDLQKREAVKSVPALLPYLSYLLHFQSVLTGPACFYADWVHLTEGTHVPVDKDGKTPSAWTEAVWKFGASIFFLLGIALVEHHFPVTALTRTDQNIFVWLFLFWFTFVLQRFTYYFAWYFADAINNFSGFGFSGFDEKGEATWTLTTNVYAWDVEKAQSFKETLDAWNISTMGWLRRVAFDRAPKQYRTITTYMLSALWHGLFVGYYITFLTSALITLGGKGFRRSLRWRFLGSPTSKFVYDVITFLGTKFCLVYIAYPFVTLHAGPGLVMYKRLWFIGQIGSIFCAAVLPILLPAPREKREARKEEVKKVE